MAKTRILTQDEIDRCMNNLDELSELSEDGLEYSDDDIDFHLIVSWKDNITVIMASTFAGEKPLRKVMRYDKKTKHRVEIIKPHVIEEYNKRMGGFDLLDSIIARHKILMRSKKNGT
ncbi:piggyBac transposable element-derived protein 3 [Trichonephila inaurata madagascariensis]|uniref:PiggyBac transposable element-derived protein 3 n=1 Tax=Trichonephila inaurata madagascariensis TaxID=2747483 RepID=A0A8X6YIZ4_9ARAC|nr:piggyBac transposable element-derived protein 3 [Trichonephila inaurata madagascariensis]